MRALILFAGIVMAAVCAASGAEAGPKPPPDVVREHSLQKPECWFESREPAPAIYPRVALERRHQGIVVVRFTARTRWSAPRAALVEDSSGFDELDTEALKALKRSKIRTNCPGVVFRYQTVFDLPQA